MVLINSMIHFFFINTARSTSLDALSRMDEEVLELQSHIYYSSNQHTHFGLKFLSSCFREFPHYFDLICFAFGTDSEEGLISASGFNLIQGTRLESKRKRSFVIT